MKKIVAIFVLTIFTLQMAVAKDVVTRDVNKLPAPAKELIAKHFPKAKISYIKIDKDIFQSATYDVTLTSGTEIEFNSKGEWLDVDCKKATVPAYFVPDNIAKYIKDNFSDQRIIQIERGRKGYDVSLSNGLDVKFDRYGGFLKLDN